MSQRQILVGIGPATDTHCGQLSRRVGRACPGLVPDLGGEGPGGAHFCRIFSRLVDLDGTGQPLRLKPCRAAES